MADPIDDVRDLLAGLAPAAHFAPARPGRLAELEVWLQAWPAGGGGRARRLRPLVALYVASHATELDAAGAARARLEHLAAGGGAVSAFARAQGAGVEIFDLALDRPSADPASRRVMSPRELAATFAFGMEALAKSPDLLVLGDATPGSARVAAALGCALAQGEPAQWSTPEDAAWTTAVCARARGVTDDPLGLLGEIGGRETVALLGALVAARVQGVPVLLDGVCALAAAAVATASNVSACDHARIAHGPASAAGEELVRRLGGAPLLDLGLQSGDGEGGAAALALVQLAAERVEG